MDIRQAIATEVPRLRRFARALVRDGASADDLVQDALERAIRFEHKWREGSNLRAWLFTILRNVFLNDVRKRARQGGPGAQDDPDTIGRDETASGRLAVRDLSRALAYLADDQREVVLLVGLEGMSYKETAEITGVPVGTVMSRLARGRERLRRLMEGENPITKTEPTLRRVK